MISIRPMSDEEWLVTVNARSATTHRVRVTGADLAELGLSDTPVEKLLEASFRFLLDREPNTSILPSFDLPVIGQYFPEFRKEVRKYLGRE
jgi:hypothetical protein